MSNSVTPWTIAGQTSLSFTVSQNLLKFTSIEPAMLPHHLILCHPRLLSFCLWSFPASGSIPLSRLFASGGQSIGALFSASVLQLSILLISFRTDWFDLPVVQGTLKSPLQHCSSKASVLQRSAFFMVQFSHPYIITGKTIDLTI